MSYHSWTSKPPTKEYQDAHPGEFSKWAEKYCDGCGRLPAWCECVVELVDEGRARRLAIGKATAADVACGNNPTLALKRYLPKEKRG